MLGRLFRKWRGGPSPTPAEEAVFPNDGAAASAPDGSSRPKAPASVPAEERKEAIPPTVPPGRTLREYLDDRIRDRCRWLEGRYGKGKGGEDHSALLESLMEPGAVAIRRPPMAAQRLLQENRRGDASLDKLAKIIETDPALLQALLKHANSVFYSTGSGGSPVVSVPPALQRLGSKGIEIVVMSHMVEGALCRPGEGMDELAGKVWAHMVRVAPLARALAPTFEVDADEAYALGLLHDVGKLILFNRIADLRRTLRRPARLSEGFVPAALRELHEPLGSLAVLEWGLGEEAALAVTLHHRNPTPQPPLPVSEVVFLAEKLDIIRQRGEEPNLEILWAMGDLSPSRDPIREIWEAHQLQEGEGKEASAA